MRLQRVVWKRPLEPADSAGIAGSIGVEFRRKFPALKRKIARISDVLFRRGACLGVTAATNNGRIAAVCQGIVPIESTRWLTAMTTERPRPSCEKFRLRHLRRES